MVARCDGEHLGQMLVLQLSKQSLIYGPLQIEARIGSDQNISKDLSLWNQQGSQVLRGHMLVLPIEDTFLYVEPIYIQSAQTKMPQLKKVVLAMGNTLIYRDTYEEALADLGAGSQPTRELLRRLAARRDVTNSSPPAATPATAQPGPAAGADPRVADYSRSLAAISGAGVAREVGRSRTGVGGGGEAGGTVKICAPCSCQSYY